MIKKLLILTLLTVNSVFAFDAKEKPVTVVIPFAPGGGVESTFRNMQRFAHSRGIELIPRYKPGAEGTIGIKDLIDSPNDGRTVSITTAGSLGFHQSQTMQNNPNILTGLVGGNSVFVTSINSNITSLSDFERLILRGDRVNIGVAHAGQRMAFDQLFDIINAKKRPEYIPYKGAGQAVQDLAGGHIDILFVPITVVRPLVDSGKATVIATSKIKLPIAPRISSIHKQWKDIELHVFLVPEGTDPNAVQFWNSFLKDYLSSKEVSAEFEKTFAFTVPFSKSYAEEIVKLNKEKLLNIR